MEYLRAATYLDIAAKSLSLAGVAMLVFGHGGWFAAGLALVFVGVLLGAWSMVAARGVRSPGGPARPAPFGGLRRKAGGSDKKPDA
jgi:hypothetical protein